MSCFRDAVPSGDHCYVGLYCCESTTDVYTGRMGGVWYLLIGTAQRSQFNQISLYCGSSETCFLPRSPLKFCLVTQYSRNVILWSLSLSSLVHTDISGIFHIFSVKKNSDLEIRAFFLPFSLSPNISQPNLLVCLEHFITSFFFFWLKQQKFISHSSNQVQEQCPQGWFLMRALLLSRRWSFSHYLLIRLEEKEVALWCLPFKAINPTMQAPLS